MSKIAGALNRAATSSCATGAGQYVARQERPDVDLQRSSALGVTSDAPPVAEYSPSTRVCPCGTSLFSAAPDCAFTIAPDALRSIPIPAGLTLVPGGSPHRPLELTAPPPIELMTTAPAALLDMLRYAGMSYAAADSPAVAAALHVFAAGRALALHGPYDAVTVDWDHTFANHKIVEDLLRLIRVRGRRSPPPPAISATPLIAIETARPFMTELVFGMMVGFAVRQGLARLSEWERYRPRVGLATHTWPDRLARSALYAPILPLMEGLLPGSAAVYERFTSAKVRSIIHLHHFLDYAASLLRRFDAHGFAALTPDQADELMSCLEDGGAHHRKPIGAWAMRGWTPERLLHIDDSPMLVADLTRQAALAGHAAARFLRVPQPHSHVFAEVKPWHMMALPAVGRSRPAALRSVVADLARKEWTRSALPDVLRELGYPLEARRVAWPNAALPAGVVMTIYRSTTSLGEFWNYYVSPVVRVQALIRDVRRRHGGLRAIQRAWRARAPRQKREAA